MLKTESVINVIDNTWAKRALIIWIPGWTGKKTARVWDVVVVVIKAADFSWTVKKWQVVRAMVVRTRKEIKRDDGTYIRFWDNAVIVLDINEKGEMKPKWKRIFWPVARELRDMWHKDITNIAEQVL